jgi:hypothetical protein
LQYLADIPEADLEIHVEDCGGEVEGELSQAKRGSSIPIPEKKCKKIHFIFSIKRGG